MLKDEFDLLYEEGAHRCRMMSIGLHDRLSGHANSVRVLERYLTYTRSKPDVWFARKDEIAAWALERREVTLPGSAAYREDVRMPDLQGRRVLVLDESGGIGAATTRAFVGAGAQVVTAGRPSDRLNPIAVELGSAPGSLDLLGSVAIEAFFSREQPLDHVVIAAAATKTGSGRRPAF